MGKPSSYRTSGGKTLALMKAEGGGGGFRGLLGGRLGGRERVAPLDSASGGKVGDEFNGGTEGLCSEAACGLGTGLGLPRGCERSAGLVSPDAIAAGDAEGPCSGPLRGGSGSAVAGTDGAGEDDAEVRSAPGTTSISLRASSANFWSV
jgi:hypothetical protein